MRSTSQANNLTSSVCSFCVRKFVCRITNIIFGKSYGLFCDVQLSAQKCRPTGTWMFHVCIWTSERLLCLAQRACTVVNHWIRAHIYRYLCDWTAHKSKQYTWLTNNQFNEKLRKLAGCCSLPQNLRHIIYSNVSMENYVRRCVSDFACCVWRPAMPKDDHVTITSNFRIFFFCFEATWASAEPKRKERKRQKSFISPRMCAARIMLPKKMGQSIEDWNRKRKLHAK